jgi:hypothetical protein
MLQVQLHRAAFHDSDAAYLRSRSQRQRLFKLKEVGLAHGSIFMNALQVRFILAACAFDLRRR